MTSKERLQKYQQLVENVNKGLSDQKAFQEACVAAFTTEGGQAFLEYWKNMMIFSPVADPNLDEKHAYFKEGMNSLIREILLAIDTYKFNNNHEAII